MTTAAMSVAIGFGTLPHDGDHGTRTGTNDTVVTSHRSEPGDQATRPPIFLGGGGGGPSGPTPSTVDYEWTVKRDIEELASGNDSATGMWSDGTTLWLVDNPDGAGDAVYAYNAMTGERVEDREFELDERNRAPRGIWSDGEGAVWVSDSGRDHLFAYDLATGERLEDRDIELAEGNADARGIWSDGETMWVLDDRANAVFAYDLEAGALLAEYGLDSSNSSPRGIWSDGVTLWVSDPGSSPRRLFAYRLPTRNEAEAAGENASLERIRDEDFTHLSSSSNNSPRGIWSDGDVMYVADESDGKVYTYNMPDAIDARLASLSLSGVDFGEFDGGQYRVRGHCPARESRRRPSRPQACSGAPKSPSTRPTPTATRPTATRCRYRASQRSPSP